MRRPNLFADGLSRRRRALLAALSFAVASAVWLPTVHLLFAPGAEPLDARWSGALAAHQLGLWTQEDLRARELLRMRKSNAEWDFMGRTYLVLALCNLALREPERAATHLSVVDAIIDETLRLEREHGFRFFMMDYARQGTFRSGVDRSLFVDGELALMLGARRLVAERADYVAPMRERIDAVLDAMGRSPALVGESYPDEGWMFCNAVALVAVRLHDVLDGADHGVFFDRWLATAREKLVDPATGLLVSSFTYDGGHLDGPEGSSIWMVVHCLEVLFPTFAADQYRRARAALGRELLGFGWAAEWPRSWQGPRDVDSGPVIPVLDVSAGSSGLAFLGAATFRDQAYLRALRATLDFAAFPMEREGRLHYAASNQVGDAVLLYASVVGPLWGRVRRHAPAE